MSRSTSCATSARPRCRKPNREIVEHGFFALGALPDDTTRATRARLAEVFDGVAVSELW